MTIGQRVIKLREKNNMSVTRLAILMGHDNSDIVKGIESDTLVPTDLQMEILAQIFKVTRIYIKTGGELKEESVKVEVPSVNVEVKKSFKLVSKIDFIVLAIMATLFTLIPVVKAYDTRQYLYIILMFLNVILLIYYVIIYSIRSNHNKEVISIPVNRKVVYVSSFDINMVRKFRRDKLTLGILMVVLNVFYYGILFTTLNKRNHILAYIVLAAMIIFIAIKITIMVLNYRNIEKTNLRLIVLVHVVELILGTIFLATLSALKELSLELGLFGGFNLFVSYLLIIALQFILNRYKYKIE